jgi:hypothetical protein
MLVEVSKTHNAHIAHKSQIHYHASMKIYFTCSTAEYKKYRDGYHAIRNYLVEQGHVLTRDWLWEADERLESGDTKHTDVKRIYRACITAIKEADLVIVEDTGHQITVALRSRKPTLVLWRGQKHQHFASMFIHGIESELLQVSEYTDQNLEAIMKVFIAKFADNDEDGRFNLVINGRERNYLDWVRFNGGKSRTKALREALQKTMDEDEGYREYLLKKT